MATRMNRRRENRKSFLRRLTDHPIVKGAGLVALVPFFLKTINKIAYIFYKVSGFALNLLEIISSSFNYKTWGYSMDFNNTTLYGLSNKKYLSDILNIEVRKLKDIDNYYRSDYYVADNGKKKRYIFPPSPGYKKKLRVINRQLGKLEIPDFAVGGIKDRSYITNGSTHINNTYFLLLDLKDFYPSTVDYYVYGFFNEKLNMSVDIARILTLFTTEYYPVGNKNRHLPQGYPTSPLLSLLSYIDMYREIERYSNSQGITFSCYVDDLTFSSQNFISKTFKRNILKIIRKYGFFNNRQKTRHGKFENGVNITGTIVKGETLLAPNNLQEKMIRTYDEVAQILNENPNDVKKLKTLINKLQGYSIAVSHIERERSFLFVEDKLKEAKKHIRRVR